MVTAQRAPGFWKITLMCFFVFTFLIGFADEVRWVWWSL